MDVTKFIKFISKNKKTDFNNNVAFLSPFDISWIEIWLKLIEYERYEFVKQPCEAFIPMFNALVRFLDKICDEKNYRVVLTFGVITAHTVVSDVSELIGWEQCAKDIEEIASIHNKPFGEFWAGRSDDPGEEI